MLDIEKVDRPRGTKRAGRIRTPRGLSHESHRPVRQLAPGFVQYGSASCGSGVGAGGNDDRDRRDRRSAALQRRCTGGGYPLPVERLRSQLAAADAVLFVTPEHTYSVHGRPQERHRLGVATAEPAVRRPSPSPSWARAPACSGRRVRNITCARCCTFSNALPVNKPEVMIGQAADSIRGHRGDLTDETTRDLYPQASTVVGSLDAATSRLGGRRSSRLIEPTEGCPQPNGRRSLNTQLGLCVDPGVADPAAVAFRSGRAEPLRRAKRSLGRMIALGGRLDH